jgi:hypothetical protein
MDEEKEKSEEEKRKEAEELGFDLPETLPKSERKSPLVDIVESLIRAEYERSELRKYLKAIENKDAVTGSVEWDRAKAAELVTEIATEKGLAEYFDGVLLTKVRAAVNRAMNRMKIGTTQRLERKKLLENKKPPEEEK